MTDNSTTADDSEPLMVKGRPVSRVLMEERPLRRCRLEECQSYCCSGGVWIHTRQVADLLAHQELIKPHLPPERRDASKWFDGIEELDHDWPEAGNVTGTAVVADPTHPAGSTCVFLNPNRLCALQTTGIAAGEHPWRFKPFYCALHPLGLDGPQLALEEDSEICLEGGTCSRPTEDGAVTPVYALFDVETKLVLGDEGFAELHAQAQRLTAR